MKHTIINILGYVTAILIVAVIGAALVAIFKALAWFIMC